MPELGQGLVEPVLQQPLEVIGVARHRAIATALPPHVAVAVGGPRLAERRVREWAGRRLRHRRLGPWTDAVDDRAEDALGFGARLAGLEATDFADLDADALALAVGAQVALHHERLGGFADQDKEAGQLLVAHDPLSGGYQRHGGERGQRTKVGNLKVTWPWLRTAHRTVNSGPSVSGAGFAMVTRDAKKRSEIMGLSCGGGS